VNRETKQRPKEHRTIENAEEIMVWAAEFPFYQIG
jgi:hypothetical protein